MNICNYLHEKEFAIKKSVKWLLGLLVGAGLCVVIYLVGGKISNYGKTVDSFCAIILSGLLGSALSSVIMLLSFQDSNKQLQAQNQLTLREMFAEKRRWHIHLLLSRIATCNDDYIDDDGINLDNCVVSKLFTKEKRKKINKMESDNELKKMLEEELIKRNSSLDDYLGIFEIAYKMLKNGTLDRDMFFTSYSYRINCFTKSDTVHNKIFDTERAFWPCLRKLIAENDAWIASHKTKTEESK